MRLVLAVLMIATSCPAQELQWPQPQVQRVECSSIDSSDTIRVIPVTVPRREFELAKMKARLADLLRESVKDESVKRGIVNAEREKEIHKLMHGIQNWVPDNSLAGSQ